MRVIIISTILAILTTETFAQKTEFSVQFNSGLFSFGGMNSTDNSFINIGDGISVLNSTINPYGKQSGFSYGFGIQIQRVNVNNLVFGLQTGYESLTSKVTIDFAATNPLKNFPAGSYTYLTNKFININPYMGKRYEILDGILTDIKLGLDFGVCLSIKEEFNLKSIQGDNVSGSLDIDKPQVDYRPRLEVVNYFRKIGLSIGYSYGLTNYKSLYGSTMDVKSRYFRLGLSYLIK
jgi:hypothetical protein